MSTSADHPTSPPRERLPLRVRLLDRRTADEIDGAWWPQSRDLQVEAADLIDHLPAGTGYVNRLLFSRPDWDDALVDGRGARRIAARRGPVKVGSFPDDDTRTMVLVLADGRRLRLQIIPSSASAAEATEQLATLAGSPGGAPDLDWSRWDAEVTPA